MNKYNNLSFISLIGSVYINCISKLSDKLNEEALKFYTQTDYYYKKYYKGLKNRYSYIYKVISKQVNMQSEENLKRITWLLLGYHLFLEYMEIDNASDMMVNYKNELIHKLCNIPVVAKKGIPTTKEQVDSFCVKIYDIY